MVALRTFDKKNIKRHHQGKTLSGNAPQHNLQPYKKLISLEQSAGNRSIARLMEQEPGKIDQARLLADPNRFLNQRQKKGRAQAGGQENGGSENKTAMENTQALVRTIASQAGIKKRGKSADDDPAKKPALNRIIADMKIPGLIGEKEPSKPDDQKERALEESTERSLEQTDAMRISASPEQIARSPKSFIDEEARTQTGLRPGDLAETHEQIKELVKWLKSTLAIPIDNIMAVWDWAKGNLNSVTAGISNTGGDKTATSETQLARLNNIRMLIALQINYLSLASVNMGTELEKKNSVLKEIQSQRFIANHDYATTKQQYDTLFISSSTRVHQISQLENTLMLQGKKVDLLADLEKNLKREIVLLQFLIQQTFFLLGLLGTLLMQSMAVPGRAAPVHETPTAEPLSDNKNGRKPPA